MSAPRAKQLICEYGRAIPGAGHAWNLSGNEEASELHVGTEILAHVNEIKALFRLRLEPDDSFANLSTEDLLRATHHLPNHIKAIERLAKDLTQMHSS
jgi:hypothetical protein